MVNHISQYQRNNQLNQAALQAASTKEANNVSADKSAKQNQNAQKVDLHTNAVTTKLSDTARKLNEALSFAKHVPSEESLFNADKVSELKNMVDKGDIKELLARYNTDDMAAGLLNSPTAAFLR